MPVVAVPLLNESKVPFVLGRLVETLLGGAKPCPGPAWHLSIAQLALHQFPLVLMVLGVTCYETGTVSLHASCLAVGSTSAAIVLAIQCLVRHMKLLQKPNRDPKSSAYLCKDTGENEKTACCDPEETESIIPAKKFRINVLVHPLLGGMICGYAVAYLAPSYLVTAVTVNTLAGYLMAVLGAFTVCVAQYSLTVRAPPEPATFRPLDHWELRPLMRPFYVVVCFALDIVSRSVSNSWCLDANRIAHIIFVLLPLLWMLNVLPPLDALVPWAAEQIQIFLGGGSATCDDLRLLFQLALYVVYVTIVHFIYGLRWAVVIAAVFGFILSLDWVGIISQVSCQCRQFRPQISKTRVKSPLKITDQFKWSTRHLVFFGLMLVTSASAVAAIQFVNFTRISRYTLTHTLGVSLVIVLSITSTVSSLNRVHLFFGLIKNPFFRFDAISGTKSVSTLQRLLSNLRVGLVTVGGPFLMVSYISVSLSDVEENVDARVHLGYFWAVLVLRAFRWTWQQTEVALLDLTVVYLMHTFFIPEDGMLVIEEFMLVSVLHDRLSEFLSKLKVCFVLSAASITQLKQRRPYSYCLLVTNLIFSPLLLAILAGSSLLSAPLLPLFTLPVFWFGFPRPLRFWPDGADTPASASPDAVYYEICVSQLVTEFAKCCAQGSTSEVRPGDYFLARFEDRLVFLSIMESGYGYMTIRVEGLELQHTSCHAIEAAWLDQIIDDAFGVPSSKEGHRWNRRPLHTFQPFDTVTVNTHVDGRSVLTGVLDRTHTLKLLSKAFPRCLLWVLTHHCAFESNVTTTPENTKIRTDDIPGSEAVVGSPKSTMQAYAKLPRPPVQDSLEPITRNTVGPMEAWADDDDPLGTVHDSIASAPVTASPKLPEEDVKGKVRAKSSGWSGTVRGSLPGAVVDAMDLEAWSSLGWPASDRGHEPGIEPQPILRALSGEAKSGGKSKFRKLFGPRADWLDSVQPQNEGKEGLTESWMKTVVAKVKGKLGDEYREPVQDDETLTVEGYRKVAVLCGKAVMPNETVTPSLAAHVFGGELPWSRHSDWLQRRPQLKQLVIKAFRYACKLALDQALLGEVESDEELAEYLESYDKHWYLGPDTDPKWDEALREPLAGLFSFAFNPINGSFVSHVATFQKQAVALGKLNREAVRAVWATLNLELLYLTNDDEERYSIQAHASLLRNLAVQAAWPPLGYPVYVSPPMKSQTITWI